MDIHSLKKWNNEASELVKLQYVYAVVALVSLVVAGIVTLLNREAGAFVLQITTVATVAFFANLVVWSIINTLFPAQTQAIARPKNARKR